MTVFLRSIPLHLLQTIHTVCCDMYEGFTDAVRQEIKSAQIAIDRFHVAVKYRDAAGELRKHELKRLKHELDEAAYQELNRSIWAFRK